MVKEDNLVRILVSANDNNKHGHGQDLRFALKNTKFSNQFVIYQDIQRKPDSYLQLALEEILLSEVILVDATSDEETYKDRLIKFGIAFALDKQRYFFYIRENSARIGKIKSSYIDTYTIEALGYYNFIELLNEKNETLIDQEQIKPQKPTDKIYNSFSVFGVSESINPDLTKTIKEFATAMKWHAALYKPPSGINIHEELSRQVGTRTFNLFCVNEFSDISVYIAIGLALGLGIPLLIIIDEGLTIPQILSGYSGVVAYENNIELTQKLTEYAKIFFSPEIFRTWDGFTYFHLLSKIEKRLNETTAQIEIEEIEKIILSITNVSRAPIAHAHVLLGDTYRRKAQIIDPSNTNYLKDAISCYEKALDIQHNYQRCIDSINATKKLIQLIDLIIYKNYNSIPELIYLIGNDINSEQYQYIKLFLLAEVKKMLLQKDFLPAIALLAAMQKHDKSEEISELWESLDPKNFMESIQLYQENEIKIKDELRIAVQKNNEIFDQLNNAYKEIDQTKQLKTKLGHATDFYGKDIFVNFGISWATYRPIKGVPYILRNGDKILAAEGMAISSGDTVYDGNDNSCFHLLSQEESLLLELYKKNYLGAAI